MRLYLTVLQGLIPDGSEQLSLGAPKDSRTDSGCFALTDQAIRPEPPGEISLEEFLAMLRLEQRHKLAELGYQDLLGKRCSR